MGRATGGAEETETMSRTSRRFPFWICSNCGSQNHEIDAECQFCDAHECYVRGEDMPKTADGEWDETAPTFCSRCGKPMPREE
jgi:hypothetical protein